MIETRPIPAYRNPGLGYQLGRQLSQAQSAGPPVIEGPL